MLSRKSGKGAYTLIRTGKLAYQKLDNVSVRRSDFRDMLNNIHKLISNEKLLKVEHILSISKMPFMIKHIYC